MRELNCKIVLDKLTVTSYYRSVLTLMVSVWMEWLGVMTTKPASTIQTAEMLELM